MISLIMISEHKLKKLGYDIIIYHSSCNHFSVDAALGNDKLGNVTSSQVVPGVMRSEVSLSCLRRSQHRRRCATPCGGERGGRGGRGGWVKPTARSDYRSRGETSPPSQVCLGGGSGEWRSAPGPPATRAERCVGGHTWEGGRRSPCPCSR